MKFMKRKMWAFLKANSKTSSRKKKIEWKHSFSNV
jgi:hypothetical protein